MKILIAGGGKVGKSIAKELSQEGHDISLIDKNPRVLESIMESYDVITVQGNSATRMTLLEAGVEDADVFIAATNADEINMLACVTAHALNKNIHTIARIRDPEYVAQAYTMQENFGMDLIINPDRQAALEMARLLKYPGFLKRDAFAKARVEIVELRIKPKSRLANVKLMELSKVVRCTVLICAVLRDGKCIMPDGNFVLKENDRIFVTGDSEELHSLLRNIGVITMPVRHVLVAGGSKIAYYLAQELEKNNITTSIIESDEDSCDKLATLLPNTTIIHGDASKQSVLESEEIGSYDGFVSTTGIDELNIVISLYANSAKVPQIITKLSRGENSQLVDTLPIGSTVCPKDLCSMHIVRYVRAIENQKGAALTIHKIADGQAEAIEFQTDETTRHMGEKLSRIKTKRNVLLASIVHEGKVEIPNGDSTFREGDTLIVVTTADQLIMKINDIFED